MSITIIAAAWGLDALLGDPEMLPHPVKAMGRLIRTLENTTRKRIANKKVAGIMTGISVPLAAFCITAAVVEMAGWIDPRLRAVISILLIYTCLSTRCLGQEAQGILNSIKAGDSITARSRVARIVGRDTHDLDEQGIARATIESVSENTVDGIISPLLYAFLGGAPLAMAYKAISTLDSMVGYKDERYREFGWFSARLDDAANFIPARLCLIIIPLASFMVCSGRAFKTIKTMLRDGTKHPSPNAGFPESGFAGALGIKLGGASTYNGVTLHKPFLGSSEKDVEAGDIKKSIRLMWCTSIVALVFFSCCSLLVTYFLKACMLAG